MSQIPSISPSFESSGLDRVQRAQSMFEMMRAHTTMAWLATDTRAEPSAHS